MEGEGREVTGMWLLDEALRKTARGRNDVVVTGVRVYAAAEWMRG